MTKVNDYHFVCAACGHHRSFATIAERRAFGVAHRAAGFESFPSHAGRAAAELASASRHWTVSA